MMDAPRRRGKCSNIAMPVQEMQISQLTYISGGRNSLFLFTLDWFKATQLELTNSISLLQIPHSNFLTRTCNSNASRIVSDKANCFEVSAPSPNVLLFQWPVRCSTAPNGCGNPPWHRPTAGHFPSSSPLSALSSQNVLSFPSWNFPRNRVPRWRHHKNGAVR